MSLIRRILAGGRTKDTGGPGVYLKGNTLVIRAAPGQTENMIECYDEFGVLGAGVDSAGVLFTYDSVNGYGLAGFGGGYAILTSPDATYTLLEIDAHSGQTGDLIYVRDGAHHPVFRVEADGTVHIKTGGSVVADL